MKHEIIYLNESKKAYLELYLLDSEISYKTHKNWPVMIICPGGAYLISAIKEGEAVATQFLSEGYSCVVLRYSTFLNDRESMFSAEPNINKDGYYPTQILELLETIHLLRQNAVDWNLDTDKIFATGFSAGGHIVGTVATQWKNKEFISQLSFKPEGDELKLKGCILSYPMLMGPILNHPNQEIMKQEKLIKECLYHTQQPSNYQIERLKLSNYITNDTVPIFLWHTNEDDITDSKDSTELIFELQKNNIKNEYHLFSNGQHGLGIAKEDFTNEKINTDNNFKLWFELATNWLKSLK